MKDFKLDDYEKIPTGFKIPEDYFDSLSAKINARIAQKEPIVVALNRRKKIWVYAAAAVLILGLGIFTFNFVNTNQNITDEMAIENYLANQSAITEDLLVELLDKEDIEKLEIDNGLDDETIEDVLSTNANLEQYLIN